MHVARGCALVAVIVAALYVLSVRPPRDRVTIAIEDLRSADPMRRYNALMVLHGEWRDEALPAVADVLMTDPAGAEQAARILAGKTHPDALRALVRAADAHRDCAMGALLGHLLVSQSAPDARAAIRRAADTRNLAVVSGAVREFLYIDDPRYEQLIVDAYQQCPSGELESQIRSSSDQRLIARIEAVKTGQRDQLSQRLREWQANRKPGTPPNAADAAKPTPKPRGSSRKP